MPVSRDVCSQFVLHLRRHYPEDMTKFTKALWKHHDAIRETEAARTRKLKIFSTIEKVICKPPSRLFGVGSLVNGLASNSSDIDLCLFNPNTASSDGLTGRNQQSVALARAKKDLEMANRKRLIQISRLYLVKWASVPILTFQMAGYSVDIQENREHGIRCSRLLHHYSKWDDRFAALAVLIKRWGKAVGISDPKHGLLGSYALSLLVLHYLQVALKPPVLPNLQKLYKDKFSETIPIIDIWKKDNDPFVVPGKSNDLTLGELMAGFFAYYCWDFDMAQKVLSVREATVKKKEDSILDPGRYHSPIWMEDFYGKRNVARAVRYDRLFEIQSAFNDVVNQLQKHGPTDKVVKSILFPKAKRGFLDTNTAKRKNEDFLTDADLNEIVRDTQPKKRKKPKSKT